MTLTREEAQLIRTLINKVSRFEKRLIVQETVEQDAAIVNTDDVPEGSNLYFTDERAQDAAAAMVSGNTETGIAVTYDDALNKLNFDAQTAGDARYAPIAKGVTNGDSHDHNGGDGNPIAYSSLSGTPAIPVKATGAEIDTGTDDAKFATAKAIEDSSYIKAAYADAKVTDAIADGVTTIAPSQNAVFDALALKQTLDATLTSIAALGTAADRMLYTTGVDAWAELVTTAFGRSAIALANAAAGRTLFGLGTIATEAETNYVLAAGTRILSANWDIGEDRAILAELLRARDVEGLTIEDDGGNVGLFIADGGITTVANTMIVVPVTSGVRETKLGATYQYSILPGSITTAQTWTITVTQPLAGNNNFAGIVDYSIECTASTNPPSTVRVLLRGTVSFTRTTPGATAVIVNVSHISNNVGVTVTGPTAVADGFTLTFAPTASTINRNAALLSICASSEPTVTSVVA